MSRLQRAAAAMKRGQWNFDHRAPPEDGPQECPMCAPWEPVQTKDCPMCKGSGLLFEDGTAYNKETEE